MMSRDEALDLLSATVRDLMTGKPAPPFGSTEAGRIRDAMVVLSDGGPTVEDAVLLGTAALRDLARVLHANLKSELAIARLRRP